MIARLSRPDDADAIWNLGEEAMGELDGLDGPMFLYIDADFLRERNPKEGPFASV